VVVRMTMNAPHIHASLMHVTVTPTRTGTYVNVNGHQPSGRMLIIKVGLSGCLIMHVLVVQVVFQTWAQLR